MTIEKATAPAIDEAKLRRQFREAHDATQDARTAAERDRDYYDGKQLSDEELQALAARRQPAVVYNRIAPKVDALRGHADRMHAAPRAYPRTPRHEQEAESVTDAIRFVCDQSNFRQIRSDATDNLLIEGICAATVTVRDPAGEAEVVITHVPWDRFYYDPASQRADFSDAAYLGVVLWMDEADALRMFPGRDAVISGAYITEADSDTYADKPRFQWGDTTRKRIRVLQHRFLHEGKWHTAILCGGGFLRDPQVSPYLDEAGEPQCDLIAQSAYIDRDGNRYGCVRRMISPQDEINKRRSKALHLLNSTTIIMEEGAVDDLERARREVNRPDGVVTVRPGMRFEVERNSELAMGQFNLLADAKAEIDASGVNPAIEGDASGPSGRAQEMMLQSGLAEMSKVLGGLRSWTWRIYRQCWFRVRQYWTEERWVRVTDDERNLRWVGINRPVRAWEAMAQEAEQAGQPLPPEQLQAMQADPALQQVVRVDNQLAELDVDLILEDGPDSVTIQSEQFEQLVELKRADPSSIPTRAIIEASSLRNKQQVLEHLDSAGVPPQIAQQMEQLQQQLQEAQKKAAGTEIKAAELQLKQAELDLDRERLALERFRAETERMRLLQPPQITPQAPPPGGVSVLGHQ